MEVFGYFLINMVLFLEERCLNMFQSPVFELHLSSFYYKQNLYLI